MGVAGGLFPSPLHMIALAQVSLNRWLRALLILIAPSLAIDALLLVITFFFYQLVPRSIPHYVQYAGGLVVMAFAAYSLIESRGKTREEMANSTALSYAGVSAAAFAELSAPGTWIYWLTWAGPRLAEGRLKGYWHEVPFFAGGLLGYYGAAVASVAALAWGAGLHKEFKKHLFFVANVLLLALGAFYLARTYFAR